MTSNSLPPAIQFEPFEVPQHFSSEIKKKAEAKERDRKALVNRCKFHEMVEEHKNTEVFPYDASELAKHMLKLIQKINPPPENEEIN